jgi:hypothetical protein
MTSPRETIPEGRGRSGAFEVEHIVEDKGGGGYEKDTQETAQHQIYGWNMTECQQFAQKDAHSGGKREVKTEQTEQGAYFSGGHGLNILERSNGDFYSVSMRQYTSLIRHESGHILLSDY